MDKATVESVMALAFELARIREQHGAQSGMYLSEVRALRAEAERLAAQAAPTDYPSCSGNPSSCPENEGHGCCNAVAQSAPTVLSEDLTLAAVNCQHQIDADCIRLHRDPTKEGSALSQLVDRVVSAIEQSTAQPQRPTYCGTGHCSCVECVVEPQAVVPAPSEQADPDPRFPAAHYGHDLKPTAQAERAPVVQAVQAREYPPLPWGNQQPYVWFCRTKDTDLVAAFRAYVDADRASSGATTQAVRMLTRDELNDVALSEQVGWGPGEYVEAIQRKFCEVNKLRIPADGVIGGAA